MTGSSRVNYDKTAVVGGAHLANAVKYFILAKQEIALAKGMADSLAGGGADTVNLEGSLEFGADVGGGQALYTAIANLNANSLQITDTALAALSKG